MPVRETPVDPFPGYSGLYEWERQTWVRTPGWPLPDLPQPKAINAYEDIHDVLQQNFYGGQRSERSDGVVTWFDNPKFRWNGTDIREDFYGVYAASGFVEFAQSVYDETLLKAFGKIADQKTNLPVIVAEAGKTAHHILSTSTRVWDAYRSFVHRDFKEVTKLLGIRPDQHHNSWNEYKFGWMPLLMDIKGSAETFAEHQLGGRPMHFMAQAKSSEPFRWEHQSTYVPFGWGVEDASYTKRLSADYSSHIKIWIEVVNPNLTALQQMGLTNPSLVAWELVPFSFVADWFLSVGNWLRSLTAMNGLRCVSAMRSNVNDLRYFYVQPQTDRRAVGGDTTYTMYESRRSMNRRHYARSPFDLEIPNLPEFKKTMPSFDNLVSSLALLRGGFRSPRGFDSRRL